MIKEVIILAGGIGSRLQPAVNDRPKCLALVNEVPFLSYLIEYLLSQKAEHFIFSLGYKHGMVKDFLEKNYPGLSCQLSIEETPLGTGGAIKLACSKVKGADVLICNGDTLFKANLEIVSNVHIDHDSLCTLSLKPMENFDRYGTVEISENSRITAFHEKQFCKSGLINGGVYALNKKRFLDQKLPEKFSFETDFLEKQTSNLFGIIQQRFFIDIGIPEDYQRAQAEEKLLQILKK